MRLWESPLRSLRVAVVVCAAAAAGVYGNSLAGEFAYDDLLIIENNEAIHSLETLPEALSKPYWPDRFGEELGLWRPGATVLFGLQWTLFDGSPLGFHFVSLLLHVGATVLVLLLATRLLPLAAAFFGGLLFAVHPIHTEAVANVVGQAEVAAALLYLAACLLYTSIPPEERLERWRIGVIWLLFGVAFSFKEMAVTLPGALFLLDGARRDMDLKGLGEYLKRRWSVYGGLAVVAGALLSLRYQILGSVASPFAPLGAHILEEIPRIWTVAGTWPHYVRLLFFPLDLSSDYAPLVVPILYDWSPENLLGVGMALAFLALAWAAWRSAPPMDGRRGGLRVLGVGVLWFVITISPVSNFFFLSGVLLSERSLYLPSVGFVLAVGWVLERLRQDRRRMGLGAVVVVMLLMGYRTWVRNPEWKDNQTVFLVMIRDHPESGRAQWVLGDLFYGQGRVSEALKAYRRSVGLLGTEYPLLIQIAIRLSMSGRNEQAEGILRLAWQDRPELGQAPGLLAVVLSRLGRHQEAEEAARAALVGTEIGDPVVSHILALSLAEQGRYDEALGPRRDAIRQGEDHPEQWRSLADLYARIGDTVQALEALDSARVRAETEARVRQIDSLRVELERKEGGL